MSNIRFTLTKEHITLLQGFNIDWDDTCYEGAPTVDIKRPYGNSSGVAPDIHRLLTGERIGDVDSKRGELTKRESTRYEKLHREMATALEIVLVAMSFEPGIYERGQYAYGEWRRVK